MQNGVKELNYGLGAKNLKAKSQILVVLRFALRDWAWGNKKRDRQNQHGMMQCLILA